MFQNNRKPGRLCCSHGITDLAQWLIQHIAVKKDQRVESLILCSRRNVSVHR